MGQHTGFVDIGDLGAAAPPVGIGHRDHVGLLHAGQERLSVKSDQVVAAVIVQHHPSSDLQRLALAVDQPDQRLARAGLHAEGDRRPRPVGRADDPLRGIGGRIQRQPKRVDGDRVALVGAQVGDQNAARPPGAADGAVLGADLDPGGAGIDDGKGVLDRARQKDATARRDDRSVDPQAHGLGARLAARRDLDPTQLVLVSRIGPDRAPVPLVRLHPPVPARDVARALTADLRIVTPSALAAFGLHPGIMPGSQGDLQLDPRGRVAPRSAQRCRAQRHAAVAPQPPAEGQAQGGFAGDRAGRTDVGKKQAGAAADPAVQRHRQADLGDLAGKIVSVGARAPRGGRHGGDVIEPPLGPHQPAGQGGGADRQAGRQIQQRAAAPVGPAAGQAKAGRAQVADPDHRPRPRHLQAAPPFGMGRQGQRVGHAIAQRAHAEDVVAIAIAWRADAQPGPPHGQREIGKPRFQQQVRHQEGQIDLRLAARHVAHDDARHPRPPGQGQVADAERAGGHLGGIGPDRIREDLDRRWQGGTALEPGQRDRDQIGLQAEIALDHRAAHADRPGPGGTA